MDNRFRRAILPDLVRLTLSLGLLTGSTAAIAETNDRPGYDDKRLDTVVVKIGRAHV